MYKVGIDPGHGLPDVHNVGPTGYVEADGVLDISFACQKELQKHGVTVIMTRTTRTGLGLTARANIFNQQKVDIAVSIHTNACGDPKVYGHETIHSIHHARAHDGDELAKTISNRLLRELNEPLRRVFDRESEKFPDHDYYTVIEKTAMPCVIVEVAFHSNINEEQKLKDPAFRQRAGIAIAHGILEHLGVAI
jgi:N-acetylmuramoyl-L-alanine amidase